MGQHSAAIQDYDAAIRLQPNYVDAYVNRGVAKSNLKRHAAAIQDFDTAVGLQPENALTYYNRGLSKYNLGHTLAAKQDFQTALQLAERASDENLKAAINDTIRAYLLVKRWYYTRR